MNNFPVAWYYVGVLALLLVGQQMLMGAAHRDAVAKVTAQYEQKLKAAGAAADAAVAPAVAQAPAAPAEPVAAAQKPAEPAAPAPAAKPPFQTSPKSEMIIASPPPAERPASAAPLKVTFRTEPLTRSKVMLLTNTSEQARDCRISVRSAAGGAAHEFSLRLAPGDETHVHAADGRELRKGDRVRIAMAGFAPKAVTVE